MMPSLTSSCGRGLIDFGLPTGRFGRGCALFTDVLMGGSNIFIYGPVRIIKYLFLWHEANSSMAFESAFVIKAEFMFAIMVGNDFEPIMFHVI
jgi:hypothetical protein